MTPLHRLRRGTWDPLHLVMVDTQTLITGLGQGCSQEVGNPHVGTWTKSCASRYCNYLHLLFSAASTN